jgi:hypothetical protein
MIVTQMVAALFVLAITAIGPYPVIAAAGSAGLEVREEFLMTSSDLWIYYLAAECSG